MIVDLYNKYINMKVYTDEVSNQYQLFADIEKLEIEIIYHKDYDTFFPMSENIEKLNDHIVQEYINQYASGRITVFELKYRLKYLLDI